MLSNSSGDFEHTLPVVVVVGEEDEVKDTSLPFSSEPSCFVSTEHRPTWHPGASAVR